jgi:hypothetical protein
MAGCAMPCMEKMHDALFWRDDASTARRDASLRGDC